MKRQLKNNVYLVYWPQIRVLKVGFASDKSRWRAFCIRGANLLAVKEFDNSTEGYAFEDACHMALGTVCRRAFNKSEEAVPYLGGRGGGYVECYSVPGDLMESELMEFIDNQLKVLACS
jgi:hypothetical protein